MCDLPELRRDASTDFGAGVENEVLEALVPVTPFLQALQESFVERNLLGCVVNEGHPRKRQ